MEELEDENPAELLYSEVLSGRYFDEIVSSNSNGEKILRGKEALTEIIGEDVDFFRAMDNNSGVLVTYQNSSHLDEDVRGLFRTET